MKSPISRRFQRKAFALVVTVSLLVLLSAIALGFLSLSAVSLRSSSQDQAMMEARANARLALQIALGELQKEMGPDQRISANSAITSTANVPNPHWTGVWDSWVAGDLVDAPVTDQYPSAGNSTHQTIGSQPDPRMRPNYQQKNRHFRRWLLSLNPEDAANIYAPTAGGFHGTYMPLEDDEVVTLVGKGSLGPSVPDSDVVGARLINVRTSYSQQAGRGRYAWWVGDENQKAMIMADSYRMETSLTSAEKIFRQEAPASMGNTSVTGLKDMSDETQVAKIASKATIGLVGGVNQEQAKLRYHDITTSSYGILADVREGGLKRDLSTLLERNIDPNDVFNFSYVAEFQRPTSYKPDADAFKLYEFDSMLQSPSPTGMASVPIQDLAAYYQLYDNKRSGWKGGIQFSSSESSPPNSYLPDGIMVSTPDFGSTPTDFDKFLRQYTAPYRNVVLVKVEVVLHYITEVRSQAEIDAAIAAGTEADPANPDTHKLRLGITPAMTFWNPNNVPVVTHISNNPQISSLFMRETPIPMTFTFKKSTSYAGAPTQQVNIGLNEVTNAQQGELYTFYLSGTQPAIFEPGESKVFSLQFTSGTDPDDGAASVDFMNRGANIQEYFYPELELIPGWNPEKFIRTNNSRWGRARQGRFDILTFKPSDYISVDANGRNGGFNFTAISTARQRRNSTPAMYHHRQFVFQPRLNASATYNSDFTYLGFPRVGRGAIASPAPRTIRIPARQASSLISAMGNPANFKDDIPQTFFYYSWKAASETHESRNSSPPGGGAGRRFPARPFLHSSPMQSPFFESLTGSSLYNNGWSWFFMPLNNMLDAPISISTRNSGYYGGGYTAESGTTHVVQQQLPLTPPISIAGLSHARLGGHSIATEAPMAGWNGVVNPATTEAYRRVTANGFGGLAPFTSQAIGNSYAHPNIPAGKAFITVSRMYAEGVNTRIPYVDHSYLANKALWDDFFFSSITPVPGNNPIFDSSPKPVSEVAEDFFFNNEPLPNRRIIAHTKNLDEQGLTSLMGQYDDFTNGFADKIAAHLMVKGSFNINSTSVEAWKALFSSLKGKPVAYLDKDTALRGGTNLKQDTPTGVPIAAGGVPNAKSFTGSPSDPSDPEQWVGWRELTNDEIEELAKAMVRQVKKRGPFLSLSEFVNRRLDSGDPELSVKGALQAAIDDPAIPDSKAINGGFRATDRKFTSAEVSYVGATFREAMEGPVAYGSSAYVDQADVLRNLAEQLTPRGDTFVIRTYGDSLDPTGKVVARAWCEAIVQRTPDYVDAADENHVKQADLDSEANKQYGRKFEIISFRWLDASEI